MNNEDMLQSFDYLCAMVIAYDNQSRHPALGKEVEEVIVEIRKLIKDRKNDN